MFRLFRRNRDRGAAMVEFAIVLPLFLVLIFGIMEVGWLFSQQVEMRNAVREGARLAVVDFDDANGILTETCNRAAISGSGATIVLGLDSVTDDDGNPLSVTVTISKTYQSLTGFLDPIFGNLPMTSKAQMRTERHLESLTVGGTKDC